MNVTTKTSMVKIAIDKSLLKEYSTQKSSRTVYLNDGEEFQLQLFNPYDYTVAAKIFINNEELTNLLVLKPGQRIWLERYLDQPRKFKFSTYEVEDSPEAGFATRNNGSIRVEFYKERITTNSPVYLSSSTYNWNGYQPYVNNVLYSSDCSNIKCASSIGSDRSLETCYNVSSVSAADFSCNSAISTADATLDFTEALADANRFEPQSNEIETGRIEKGSHSNQDFENVNLNFYTYSFNTENLLILPTSQKVATAEDLQKIYCTNCGRKLQNKYKFCPFCGSKVE
jgi:hypothetical protein